MYARTKQFIGELVALLWMEKLFWLSFSVISVVVTGLLMSYPVGLLVSMLTHPETSLGFQPAFQKLLMINVWLLIGWMFTLDAIVTLWIWRSGFALKQLLRLNVLCHFLWRDSLCLAFALSLFLSRQVIPRPFLFIGLFTFTGMALPMIEHTFGQCLNGLSFLASWQQTWKIWQTHVLCILAASFFNHTVILISYWFAPYTFYLSFIIGVPVSLAIQVVMGRWLRREDMSQKQ